jgi:ubiquitin-protein ligase
MNPRLRRLQADYELIRDSLSGHPLITVEPAGVGLPPESYKIQYRVRGLQLEGEQPTYRDVHEAKLDLPLRYPAERPHAVPLTPIFHPNIKGYFCIADYWAAGTTLVDVIAKMGDMIQWKIYNVKSPLDTTAARWAAANETSGLFPVSNVDFGVEEIAKRSTGAGRRARRGTGAADRRGTDRSTSGCRRPDRRIGFRSEHQGQQRLTT